MDANFISEAINTLGFPIAMVASLGWYINKKDKESFFEKESESSGPSVDELLKELNLKCETVDGVMPLYELYPGWYDKPEEDVDVY